MILHLLFNDKFGEYAIRQFSESRMCSEFVIVTQGEASDNTRFSSVRTVVEETKDFDLLLDSLEEYRAIILHGLFYPWQEKILRRVPDSVRVAWVFWGGDIYGRSEFKNRYLASSSIRLKNLQYIKRWIKGRRSQPKYEIPFNLLKRIDYCLTDIPEDFRFVKDYLKTDIKELWYNYYSVEETIGDLSEASVNGNNILLGNSCSLECNHLEGMKLLKKMGLGPSSVIVPLSYGEAWLRNRLTSIGERLFGDKFQPLLDFIPRQDYNRIIQSCSVAIMPHYRPQAFGNILTALWLGTRVYLSKRNPLFAFFRRIGAVLYSLEEDLFPNNPAALTPLSDEQRNQNRTVIASIYGKEIMHQKNLEIVKVLNA